MKEFFESDAGIGLIVVVFVAVAIFLLTRNSGRSFDPFEEAERWFSLNRLDLDSIVFSAYDEPHLVRAKDAVALVGTATMRDGEDVGFAIEVVEGRGVVEGTILRPSGIATWHRSATATATKSGDSLLGALKTMAKMKASRDAAESRAETAASPTGEEELIPGVSAPLVTGGKPGPRFFCDGYVAVVTQENQSLGPISYPFIMIVVRKGSNSPIMFVTAESNDMFSEMLGKHENLTELLGDSMPTGLVLGIFDKNGHTNLGPHESISDLEGFSTVALQTMKTRLSLQGEVRRA